MCNFDKSFSKYLLVALLLVINVNDCQASKESLTEVANRQTNYMPRPMSNVYDFINSDNRLHSVNATKPINGNFVTWDLAQITHDNESISLQYQPKIEWAASIEAVEPSPVASPEQFIGKVHVWFDRQEFTGSAVALNDCTVLTSIRWFIYNNQMPISVDFSPSWCDTNLPASDDVKTNITPITVQKIYFRDKLSLQNDIDLKDFVVLKLKKPVKHLASKALSFLPTTIHMIDKYVLQFYDDHENKFESFAIDKLCMNLSKTFKNYMFYERQVSESIEGAPVFAMTEKGYFLIGLHVNIEDTKISQKKALIFDQTSQRIINLMSTVKEIKAVDHISVTLNTLKY